MQILYLHEKYNNFIFFSACVNNEKVVEDQGVEGEGEI